MDYLDMLSPEWYTGKTDRGRAAVHMIVYCQAHGLTEIPAGYVVHHKNGDRRDNRIENLELMTRADHTRYHVLHGDATPPKNMWTPEMREHFRQINLGRKHTQETKDKLRRKALQRYAT